MYQRGKKMKTNKKTLALLALMCLGAVACSDENDTPNENNGNGMQDYDTSSWSWDKHVVPDTIFYKSQKSR